MSRLARILGAAALAVALPLSSLSAQTTFRLGLIGSPGTPEYEAAVRFAELVSEKTNGAYNITVLHSGQAGGEREIAEGLQLGTMDFAVLAGILQNFDPALMIVEWDLLFKNNDHVRAAMNGEIGEIVGERINDALDSQKLAVYMRSPRLLTTNRPVETLEDLQGLRVRVPEMQARLSIWRALGASPTPMAFPEVVPALQLGTIDGQENPIGLIVSANIYEAVDYLATTEHLYGFMLLLGSNTAMDRIPEADRAAFLEAAAESAVYNDEVLEATMAAQMEVAAGRMTVTDPDVESWRAAASEVYKQFADVPGFIELYEAIVELGKDF